MKIFSKKSIFIILIFILALSLRLYGLNWDQNNHLQPDERFLTMLTNDIQLPASLKQYFDTSNSPLNPYNYSSYKFFVYGTFPVFLTKYLAVFLKLDDYNHITLLGRFLSAFFDSTNIILLYFISKKFLKSFYQLLPSFLYAFLVLPLQLSHFFAVDTFLSFFILLTFTFLVYDFLIPAFIFFGLALSCKISALYFVPVIFLFLFKNKNLKSICLPIRLIALAFGGFLISFLVFRLFQPYAFIHFFTPNSDFINSLKTLSAYTDAGIYYPPGVQWLDRPLIFDSLYYHLVWALGLSFSLPFLYLVFCFLFKKPKLKFNLIFIISFWIIFLFVFQSLQFSHTMRYFLLIYPFLCLVFSTLLSHFKIKKSLVIFILILNVIYSLAFLSIYSRPNSRVLATEWINQNISQNNVISSEYWDDALPLGYSAYQSESLAFFDPDTDEKWQKINASLDKIDYLIMSSNRLWASISRLPDKYPLTSKFYENLFSGKSYFTLDKQFLSYPGYPLPFLKSCFYFGPANYPGLKISWFSVDENCSFPGIYLRDDTAEEAFTVYDHPQVLIFKKTN